MKVTKQIENNENNTKTVGIFNLEGVKDKSQIIIRHIENLKLKEHEYVPDSLIEKYKITDQTFGEIYCCNITDTFLMRSKQLPMILMSVVIEKPMRRILLFRVYLCFTIESKITSAKQLLNSPIDGKFNLELFMDGNKRELDSKILKFVSNEQIYESMKKFVSSDPMRNLIQELTDEVNARLNETYADELDYFTTLPDTVTKLD